MATPIASTSSHTAQPVCARCHDRLVILAEPEEEGGGPVELPDDVELACSHHFHWECILDALKTAPEKSTLCPSCSHPVDTGGRVFVTVRNEGGWVSRPRRMLMARKLTFVLCSTTPFYDLTEVLEEED